MPHALLLPCFLVAREEQEQRRQGVSSSDAYTRVVRDAIRGGGCNTSRAGVVGATLAASTCGATGAEPAEWLPVPLDWIARLRDGKELLRLARAAADLSTAEASPATAKL